MLPAALTGLCHRVLHDDWPFDVEEHVKMAAHARRGLDRIALPAYDRYAKDQWEHHVTLQVKRDRKSSSHLRAALSMLLIASVFELCALATGRTPPALPRSLR